MSRIKSNQPPGFSGPADGGDAGQSDASTPVGRNTAKTKTSIGTEATPQNKHEIQGADLERLASQAGFFRNKSKKNQAFDAGDNAHAPIPLPDDDFDIGVYSYETLSVAQSEMAGHAQALLRSQAAKTGDTSFLSFVQSLIEESYTPSEGDNDKLGAVKAEPGPAPQGLKDALMGASKNFGLSQAVIEAPPGAAMMAAALLVAGAQSAVHLVGQTQDQPAHLDSRQLLGGAKTVLDKGRLAVEDARAMGQGINKNLAIQRTFVHKR